mgnify:CR=1 FL=1
MPYTEAQLKLFGIALSMQMGETPYSYSDEAAEIARTVPQSELRRMIAEGRKPTKSSK